MENRRCDVRLVFVRPFGLLRDDLSHSGLGKNLRNRGMISQVLEPVSAGKESMPQVPESAIKTLAQTFKLLSDETRLRILVYLSQTKELHVRALCDLLQQSQPAVSHHLALLRVSGLIEPRREGKYKFYHILPDRFEGLLDLVFSNIPSGERHIQFNSHLLAFLRWEELGALWGTQKEIT